MSDIDLFKKEVRLPVSVNLGELVGIISDLDRDTVKEVVMALDDLMADWQYTLSIAEEYEKLKKVYEEEKLDNEGFDEEMQ